MNSHESATDDVQRERSINDLFPYKVCINLDREQDSWERMQAALARHDIRGIRRVSAIDGSTLKLPATWRHSAGAYGCLLSHLELVRDARRRRLPSLLILEDDTLFDPCFRDKFPFFIKSLPADWDMIFLGALHREDPDPVSDNVCRIRQAYSTYAYALKHTIFDAFVGANERPEEPVDVNNFALQAKYKCYCFMPNLAWVERRYSHVQERMADHWYLRESVVTLGGEMDRILRRTVVILAHGSSGRGKNGVRNVTFLARFYDEFLKGIRLCVVEQGGQRTLDPSELPAGCRYVLLDDAGTFNRERCIAAGLECAATNCDYLIVSDSNIFMDALSIRANLRICQRYDCATGFKNAMDLTAVETEHLRRSGFAKGMDFANCGQAAEQAPFACYGVFRRDVFDARGVPLDGHPMDSMRHSALKGGQRLRVFESPNHALRLHS